MRHYQVRDVMTTGPVTVTPSTPIKEVASMLVRLQVGALPVVTPRDGAVGVVTETDLLRKEQLQRDPEGSHSAHLSYRDRRAVATAETAGEIMDPHPATVRPEAAVAEAARLMSRHQSRCLLVTDADGKLLGLVNARDMLQVFLRPDEAIKADIVGDVLPRYLGTNPVMVDVEVIDGVVRLTGELERKSMLTAVRPAVRAVDGVIDVVGRLGYAIDDTSRPPRPAELDEPETPRSPVAARRLT
jgi:CBS domain-containing protein